MTAEDQRAAIALELRHASSALVAAKLLRHLDAINATINVDDIHAGAFDLPGDL